LTAYALKWPNLLLVHTPLHASWLNQTKLKELIEAMRRDLERGLKNPHTGRSGLTPQQVLRSLILMRIKKW
jgi:hypothetical protein